MVLFRSVLIFAITFCIGTATDIRDNATELSYGREEATCRKKLSEMNSMVFYLMAGGVTFLSLVFLLISIGVFLYIQRNVSILLDSIIYI